MALLLGVSSRPVGREAVNGYCEGLRQRVSGGGEGRGLGFGGGFESGCGGGERGGERRGVGGFEMAEEEEGVTAEAPAPATVTAAAAAAAATTAAAATEGHKDASAGIDNMMNALIDKAALVTKHWKLRPEEAAPPFYLTVRHYSMTKMYILSISGLLVLVNSKVVYRHTVSRSPGDGSPRPRSSRRRSGGI